MSAIFNVIQDLIIAVVVLVAMLLIFLVVISMMPAHNPLRMLLGAFVRRLGATLAATAVAIPVEPIPGIDVVYDVGAPIFLLWYWYTFFRRSFEILRETHPVIIDQK